MKEIRTKIKTNLKSKIKSKIRKTGRGLDYVLTNSLLVAFGVIALSACSKKVEVKDFVWSQGSDSKIPLTLASEQFKNKEITILTKDEVVERAPQKIGSAEIEGAFIQKLYNKKGDLVYIKSSYFDNSFEKLKPQIEKMNVEKYAFLEKLKKSQDELKSASQIFAPKVVIYNGPLGPEPIYHIEYIDKSKIGAYRLKASINRGIFEREAVGSNFDQGKGVVFPFGPKASQLSEVLLGGLLGDGTLTKPNLKVLAQTPEKALSANLYFNYDPNDVRFDQVQAFYFVDRALTWFQTKMGVPLPFTLEVQTHIGAPEKTNAAFYYHGQIRLGPGDGINYQNMMKDPSIVTHETCHALIDAIARLPFQGEGGSLNEGFADFITTALLKNPKLGEVSYLKAPFKRTVENELKVSDKQGKLYHDSGIVSGTFWEIKEAIGEQQALYLTIKTLSRLGPTGNFNTLGQAITFALDSGFSDDEKKLVTDVLKKRQWL